MGHFGWTDAFHKQHISRVIWLTLCYWIRKQINIWREKGGSRGHHKSIHQSNHTVNNACRKLKGSLLMIKQEKQSYCWIILFFPVCFCFMKLNGICSTWLIEWQSIFFLSRMNDMPLEREGLMQMGRYHFQILYTLPFQFLQDIFDKTTKSTVKTLRGTQVELKILIPPFIHFDVLLKKSIQKILNKSIDLIGNLSLEITCRHHVDEDFIVSMASNQSALSTFSWAPGLNK